MFLMYCIQEAKVNDFQEPCYKEIALVKKGYTIVTHESSMTYLQTLGYNLIGSAGSKDLAREVAASIEKAIVRTPVCLA